MWTERFWSPKWRDWDAPSKSVTSLTHTGWAGPTVSRLLDMSVSDPVDVSTGVGEGSMLGPFIFLIQIIEVSIVMDIIREIIEE